MSDKRIPAAAIRKVWLDHRLTTAEAARAVGLSRANLWRRARLLDLPARKAGNRHFIPDAEFAALWNAGVLTRDMAGLYGVHWQTICRAAHRLGLAPRGVGGARHGRITLRQYREERLAPRLADAAMREERATREARGRDIVRTSRC